MSKYKKYPSYKDSKVEWLGDVPSDWNISKIKHLFNLGRGRVIAVEEVEDEGKYPVYSSQTKNNGVLGLIETYDYNCRQITWTTDGANAGTVFLREGKHNCTNVCGTLQARDNKDLLEYMTYSLQFSTQFYKRPDTNGAKIMNGEMAEIFTPRPPLQEQQAIANYLDKATAKIDTLIQKQTKLIELLKEKRQAVISHAVTRGLDNSVPMKDSGVEWLGEIPEHWEVKMLKYSLMLQNQKSRIGTKQLIALENIESWSGKLIDTDSVYQGEGVEFLKGDILFGKLRPYLAKVIQCHSSGIAYGDLLTYRPKDDVDSRYSFYSLLSEPFINIVDSSTYGTKMPRASVDFVNDMLLFIPPYPEQQAIANYLDDKTLKIDSLVSKATKAIELLKEKRIALISSVVTGKIDVRETA